LKLTLGEHRVGVHGGAEAGATVVEEQHLVAALEGNLGERVVLWLAVSIARAALEVDQVGQLLLGSELRGGEGDDGSLMLPNAATEEPQSASLRPGIVLGYLEE
jgi:hypothetical protein